MPMLFQESGCASTLDAISAEMLAAHLRKHPELIDGWLLDSMDRRTGSGPYLEEPRREGAPWIVGQYPEGTRTEYPDGASACAAFVMQRLSELAGDTPEDA